MSFLGPKIWNKLSSNKKTTATTVSFTNVLKKAILNKLQERAILIFDSFTICLYVHNSRETLMYI